MDNFDIKEWYLWPYRVNSGLLNMSIDRWLAHNLNRSFNRPILRFFGWKPSCISLGYHQNQDEIDFAACRNSGVEVVRRPTGGRAILHADELTYSVVYPLSKLQVSDFYRLTHLPFVETLKDIHVMAELNPSQTDFKSFNTSNKSAACFASGAQYEVKLKKKKLIGSAQRIFGTVILQHGSLLLGDQHLQLTNLLRLSNARRKELKKHLQRHTAFIKQESSQIKTSELAERIAEKFSELFGIHFTPVDESFPLFKKEASIIHPELSIVELNRKAG